MYLVLLIHNSLYNKFKTYTKKEERVIMGFLIVRGLSSILESALWTYFIISFCMVFNISKKEFSKKQIIILLLSNLISALMRKNSL